MKRVLSTTVSVVALASLAMMATATQTHKAKKPVKKTKPPIAKAATPQTIRLDLGSMAGTWTLREGDKPRTDIKMKFDPSGNFAFVGPNWQSKGKYRVEDHKLCLEWTSVDGQKVAPGVMKKEYVMGENDGSFTIDKYTYYKLGAVALKPRS